MDKHVYLIDRAHIVKLPEIPTLKQCYALLRCNLIDVVRLEGTTDVFVVDDEGAFNQQEPFNMISQEMNEHQVQQKVSIDQNIFIRGSMIYIGTDPEGNFAAPLNSFLYHGRDIHSHRESKAAWYPSDPSKESLSRIVHYYFFRDSNNEIHSHLVPYRSLNGSSGIVPYARGIEAYVHNRNIIAEQI